MIDFFNKDVSQSYDEKNKRLAPIVENMHFLIRLILQNLPEDARILCVGVGTGAEIFSLSRIYPKWQFVGVDPSAAMLEVCKTRLQEEGIAQRCTLIHGDVHNVPDRAEFDAVLAVLVGHFIPRDEKKKFYRAMQSRLKTGGIFINTEISYDLSSPQFPAMLENWARVQGMAGANPQSLQDLSMTLRDVLCVLPIHETENLIRAAGIKTPVHFFQSFMINGWFGKRE